MDYAVRHNPKNLESTGFIEIMPGRYTGKHWQDGAIFIWEDAFTIAEGIIQEYFPQYDHLAMNDIPRSAGRLIAKDLQNAADTLQFADPASAGTTLRLPSWFRQDFDKEFLAHR